MNLPQANLIILSMLKLEREMKTQTLVQENHVPHETCNKNLIDIIHKRCTPLLQITRKH